MAKTNKASARKPTQSKSKVALAHSKLTSNVANKSQAQYEREMRAYEEAKKAARLEKAYEKEYARVQTAMAKQQARMDALKESAKNTKKAK